MGPLKTLEEACTPRASVFEPGVADTVYSIDDLDQIDPRRFFAENCVAGGMRLLLTEAFKRLEGRSASASGTFILAGRVCSGGGVLRSPGTAAGTQFRLPQDDPPAARRQHDPCRPAHRSANAG